MENLDSLVVFVSFISTLKAVTKSSLKKKVKTLDFRNKLKDEN
jgi:hypothetical protein